MKQKLTKHVWILLLVVAGACRSTSPEKEVAHEFCQCFRSMTELYQQVQSRDESATEDQLVELMRELETAAAASEDCVERVEMDYGDLIDQKEEAIKTAMQQLCPEVVETLEAIDQGYE